MNSTCTASAEYFGTSYLFNLLHLQATRVEIMLFIFNRATVYTADIFFIPLFPKILKDSDQCFTDKLETRTCDATAENNTEVISVLQTFQDL